ncbi:unnamed protein product [Caenorhabditis brenneri]
MRIALLGAFITLLCVSTAFAKNVTDPADEERNGCLKRENDHRKKYAEKLNIGNMVKLEYDKEFEKVKPPKDFHCPKAMEESVKYGDGLWATESSQERTAEAVLASKMACVKDEKCGLIYVINRPADQREGKKGKPGSACSGKSEDGLCLGSASSNAFLLIFVFFMSIYL